MLSLIISSTDKSKTQSLRKKNLAFLVKRCKREWRLVMSSLNTIKENPFPAIWPTPSQKQLLKRMIRVNLIKLELPRCSWRSLISSIAKLWATNFLGSAIDITLKDWEIIIVKWALFWADSHLTGFPRWNNLKPKSTVWERARKIAYFIVKRQKKAKISKRETVI